MARFWLAYVLPCYDHATWHFLKIRISAYQIVYAFGALPFPLGRPTYIWWLDDWWRCILLTRGKLVGLGYYVFTYLGRTRLLQYPVSMIPFRFFGGMGHCFAGSPASWDGLLRILLLAQVRRSFGVCAGCGTHNPSSYSNRLTHAGCQIQLFKVVVDRAQISPFKGSVI